MDYNYLVVEHGTIDRFKWGYSKNPMRRPKDYQVGNSRNLVTVLAIVGGYPLETEFKRIFSDHRIGTGGDEWFRFSPAVLDWISGKVKESLSQGKFNAYSEIQVTSKPERSLETVETGLFVDVSSLAKRRPFEIVGNKASVPVTPKFERKI